MSHRIPLCLVLIASLAACTETAPPGRERVATASDPLGRDWQCVSLCFPGLPCHNICRLSPLDPGFAIVPAPWTCDSLRPINVCGDGCCDAEEAKFAGSFCAKDCVLQKLEVSDRLKSGSLQILDGDRVLGTVDPGFVAINPSCK